MKFKRKENSTAPLKSRSLTMLFLEVSADVEEAPWQKKKNNNADLTVQVSFQQLPGIKFSTCLEK